MEKPKMTDLFAFEIGHIKMQDWAMVCGHCGETHNWPRKPQSLKNHIHAYYGFILMHIDCKEGEPGELAKIFQI